MQRLISIQRRPAAIVAVVSERGSAFSPRSGSSDEAAYRERVEPLSAVSEEVCPFRDKDVKAWRALSRVPSLGGRAGLAIVRAIIGSVADPATAPDGLPELHFGNGAVDLRPYLCSADGEEMLLGRIGAALDEVTRDLDFPDWHWKQRQEIAALPAQFRRSFLWGLHLSQWSMVRVTLAVYDQLGLESDPALCRAMARLLSLADRKLGIAWCEVIGEVAPENRARVAEIIMESGGYGQEPGEDSRRALAEADWPDAFELLSAER